MKKIVFVLFVLIAILMSACTSMRTNDQYKEALFANIASENYQGAINIIEQHKEDCFSEKDRVLYYLYMGILNHYNSNYQESTNFLNLAEESIDELYTESVAKAAGSMLLNDNTLAYTGEDYENIYVNIIKCLNYIALDDQEAAFVEVRKVNEKLQVLEDLYREYVEELNQSDDAKIQLEAESSVFMDSALARYLSMLLYRADDELDDAKIDKRYLQQAFFSQENIYDFPVPKLKNVLDIPKGKTKLNVIALTGLSPEKEAVDFRLATGVDQVGVFRSDQQETDGEVIFFPGVEPGYYFKFSVAKIKAKSSLVDNIVVEANNQEIGRLSKLEDVNNIAVLTFEKKAKMAFVRAITRTTIKGIASILAQKKIEKETNEFGGFLAKIATAALTEASEAADLRICSAFPGNAYVGDFDIETGTYNICVKYFNNSGLLLYQDFKENFVIDEDNFNVIESKFLK